MARIVLAVGGYVLGNMLLPGIGGAIGLTALAGEMLAGARTGKNGCHALVGHEEAPMSPITIIVWETTSRRIGKAAAYAGRCVSGKVICPTCNKAFHAVTQ